jgi:hypothetical protein
LPVADGGDSHALALAGALDHTTASRACWRGRSTAAVTVKKQRATRLAHGAYARARVQLALAVESGQDSERCDTMMGMAAELRIHQKTG